MNKYRMHQGTIQIILRNYVIDYKLYFQSRENRRMDDWMGSIDVSNMAWGLI